MIKRTGKREERENHIALTREHIYHQQTVNRLIVVHKIPKLDNFKTFNKQIITYSIAKSNEYYDIIAHVRAYSFDRNLCEYAMKLSMFCLP